jgi:hypothetical protein
MLPIQSWSRVQGFTGTNLSCNGIDCNHEIFWMLNLPVYFPYNEHSGLTFLNGHNISRHIYANSWKLDILKAVRLIFWFIIVTCFHLHHIEVSNRKCNGENNSGINLKALFLSPNCPSHYVLHCLSMYALHYGISLCYNP